VSVGGVFGELLGWQFAEMWERLGRPGESTIVEQGANDGMFAGDVLGWCERERPDFFEAVRYWAVERNSKGLEREVRSFEEKVTVRNSMEELPQFTGAHFSNELVDAFPVHLVRYREGEWKELWVTGGMGWEERMMGEELREAAADLPRVEGYTSEVNLEAGKWATEVAKKIERGWILTIDYGFPREIYYAGERMCGTLECYAGQAKGLDPLARPGFCDLTAHVEFTGLARAFLAARMELAGYTDQHHFLTGVASRVFAEHAPTAKEARGLKTLLHPEMLGRAFQVLGMSRGVPEGGLAGFRYARDARRELGL
jgi:SAM-dependent MidA family methyltransferase